MEAKVWQVPRGSDFPEGLKISLSYQQPARTGVRTAYVIDNERGKGLHEHVGDREAALGPMSLREVYRRFGARVRELRREWLASQETQD